MLFLLSYRSSYFFFFLSFPRSFASHGSGADPVGSLSRIFESHVICYFIHLFSMNVSNKAIPRNMQPVPTREKRENA